jgi:uncharacterized protein (DUF1800 family)
LDRQIWVLVVAMLALAACGGSGGGSSGGGGPPPPAPATLSRAEAWRFLEQATFGPTEADADLLMSRGYVAWLDQQMAVPASHHLPAVQSQAAPQKQVDRLDAWFQAALKGDDQLRQKVAWALSQIWVVSDVGALGQQPLGLAYYYDVLVDNAFGNYRRLMEQVTLTPAMGVYLSMLGNQKPDPARNIFPDENYARELMQLFTIGLVQLNPDGSVRTDEGGNPQPTYDQQVIEGFAHVFTGWTFAGALNFERPRRDFLHPMLPFEDYHDTGAKLLLNGATLPAGQGARADLEAALDNIFNHPNLGPFVSRQLIQRLVASNPTPAYLGRVAAVFADDGNGERGNLAAVVRAILLDPEARSAGSDSSGKLKEPLLRLTQLWRAYDAGAQNGRFLFANPQAWFGQAPLRAPSVFNFYSPGYAPPGEIAAAGLVAPEMQITTEYTTALTNSYLALAVFQANTSVAGLRPETIAIDFSAHLHAAADPARLVQEVADRLAGGVISDELRRQAAGLAEATPASNAALRVAEVLHLMVTSPEFAVQK